MAWPETKDAIKLWKQQAIDLLTVNSNACDIMAIDPLTNIIKSCNCSMHLDCTTKEEKEWLKQNAINAVDAIQKLIAKNK